MTTSVFRLTKLKSAPIASGGKTVANCKGDLAILLGRIGRAPKTIPIDVLLNAFTVNVVGVFGIKGSVIVR